MGVIVESAVTPTVIIAHSLTSCASALIVIVLYITGFLCFYMEFTISHQIQYYNYMYLQYILRYSLDSTIVDSKLH